MEETGKGERGKGDFVNTSISQHVARLRPALEILNKLLPCGRVLSITSRRRYRSGLPTTHLQNDARFFSGQKGVFKDHAPIGFGIGGGDHRWPKPEND